MQLKVFSVLALVALAGNFGLNAMHAGDGTETKPFEEMRTCDIIRYYGYPCEIHEVTTKDGYILELHRIPHSKNAYNKTNSKGVVFLQHGLLESSFTWVANPPNMSLAYILSRDGFDVWMGNTRGNTYSTKHVILSKKEEKYWQFSFDEFGKYDVPAAIDFILTKTNQRQLRYVGHSQGTTMAFAAFSTQPALTRKVKLFVALAPVTHITHVKGLMGLIRGDSILAKLIIKVLGHKDFLPTSWVVKKAASLICRGPIKLLCSNVLVLITGFDTSNLIDDRIRIYLSHTPAGTSVKNMVHFHQISKANKFQMFDYGWNGNMHRYLQPFPPEYELESVDVPTALFVGDTDWLATEQDVTSNVRVRLPNIIFDQDIHHWNHMDFVWGKRANEVLYPNVIKLLNGQKPEQ